MNLWGGSGGFECGGKNSAISKKGNFPRNRKITCENVSWNPLKYCLSFGAGLEGSNGTKWGGNKK